MIPNKLLSFAIFNPVLKINYLNYSTINKINCMYIDLFKILFYI